MSSNLLDLICEESCDIKVISLKWLEKYSNNDIEATADLIILLYCIAGSKPFTRGSIRDLDPTELFVLKSDDFQEFEVDQRVLSKFSEFLDHVLSKTSFEILSNRKFMDAVQSTLRLFAEADRSSFRLVGVVIGTKLMTSALMIDAHRKKELERLENYLRDWKTSKYFDEKIFGESSSQLVEVEERRVRIVQKVKRLKEFHCYFEEIFLQLMSSLFREVLRSFEVDVRKVCHNVIGVWMEFINLDYFRNSYFSLFPQLLSDPEDELREMAVLNYFNCLQKHIGTSLETKHFSIILKRLLILSRDEKNGIKILALKCLNSIDRCKPELISPREAEEIFLLIYHDQREVSSEAGHFLHNRIISLVGMNSEEYINEVLSFLEESPESCSEDFLVDSLINKSNLLCDWSAWIKLLLKLDLDHNEIQGEILMRLLACTLKLANTGILPVGRNAKKKNSVGSIRSMHIKKSSEIIGKNINFLWTKYEERHRTFYHLLKCISFLSFEEEEVSKSFIFNLTLKFQSVLQSKNLALCHECGVGFAIFCTNLIKGGMLSQSSWKIIENGAGNVSKSLERLCYVIIQKIIKSTLEKPEEKQIEIAALHCLKDLTESSCWQSLFSAAMKIIASECEKYFEVARLCLNVCFMSIMWISVYFVEKNIGDRCIEIIYSEKLKEASHQFFLMLDLISKRDNSRIRVIAKKIISWLNKLSYFIKKNDGITFLVYH